MTCETFNAGGVTVIACSRGDRGKRCSAPGCANKAPFLCDFALANGKTCDRPICRAHATRPDPSKDIDYCGPHARGAR